MNYGDQVRQSVHQGSLRVGRGGHGTPGSNLAGTRTCTPLNAANQQACDLVARLLVISQQSSPTGTLLSTAAVGLVSALPKEQFLAWGWRLPYLASVVLVLVALWLRWKIEETPAFRALAASHRTEKAPVVQLFKAVPGRLVVGIATYLFSNAGFFIITTFVISYATRVRELPSGLILKALTIGALGQIVGLLVSGRLANRFG
jgi:predicted MFS family arabinose efflux permease